MRLLLAEDERDLSNAIKRILEMNKYEVDVAYDGIQALNRMTERQYDLLILDVMMPRLDGFGVAKEVRRTGSDIPIIMLTAKSEIDDKVLGLDSGADDYLTKPFQVKELLARIRALLRRRNEEPEVLKMGDFTLDKSNYTLNSAKGSVKLTDKEFRVVEVFIRHEGKLLSTERIMELAWSYDSDAELNVVWAYISSIRKKLAQIGSEYTVVSSRGVGYQIGRKS